MVFLMVCLLTLPSLAEATTITVSKDGTADFTNLTDAVAAAAPNDQILIGPGTYEEGATVAIGIPLFILGSQDPKAPTVFVGNGTYRILNLHTAALIEISDITFRNGFGAGICDSTCGGAAIVWQGGDAEFNRCRFEDNVASTGAALYITNETGIGSSARCFDCVFTGGYATGMGGAAFVGFNARATFERCEFDRNWTGIAGTVATYFSDTSIRGCLFTYNVTQVHGSALWYKTASGGIFGNTFEGNTSLGDSHYGGGTYAPEGATIYLTGSRNQFNGNILANENAGYGVLADNVLPDVYLFHSCNVFWQNALGPIGTLSGPTMGLTPDEVVADPMFCDPAARDFNVNLLSPAAPNNSPCDVLIGAFPASCQTPVIESFSPLQGPAGSQVGIVGHNFNDVSNVAFNGTSSAFTIMDNQFIIATVPVNATSGPLTVAISARSDTADAPFTVGPYLGDAGINLSWNDCGAVGVANRTFACNTNSGSPFSMVASFRPPPSMFQFLGLSAVLTVANSSGALVDWWKHGTGQCRGTASFSSSFDFTSDLACQDFFLGQAAGGHLYEVGAFSGDPAKARILVQAAVPEPLKGPLIPGLEYYGFKLRVARGQSTGPGSCPGCEAPICIELNEVQLFQPAPMNNDPKIFTPADGTIITWQSPAFCGTATPVLAALVVSESFSDHNRIVWEVPRSDAVLVYRREGDGNWVSVARETPDQDRRIEYWDGDVIAGTSYGYRLGIMVQGEEIFAGEVSLTVPVPPHALSLSSVALNGNQVIARITLTGSEPAMFEIFDASGRRTVSKRLEGLVPGEHSMSLASRLQPGVYFARLTQAAKSVGAKFVVIQ